MIRHDFLLEPLEPRCLLDASVYEDSAVGSADRASAALITTPAIIHQHVSTGNDYYRIPVSANTVYDVRFSSPSIEYYEVQLCDEFWMQWANPWAAQWRYTDSQCFLNVYSTLPAEYTLTVTAAVDDPAQGIAQSKPIRPGLLTSQFSDADQFSYYSFSAVAGSRYLFDATPDTLSGITVLLRDASGVPLYGDDSHNTQHQASLEWIAPASGKYYVEVGGYSGGSYQLSMSADIDDQANQGRSVSPPGIVQGSIDHPYDKDTFTFDAVPGYVYLFHPLPGTQGSPAMELFTSDGQTSLVYRTLTYHPRYLFYQDNFDSMVWTPDQPGTYQLQVWDESAYDFKDPQTAGDYSIAVEAFPVSSLSSEAPLLSPGENRITVAPDSQNWFSFDAVKGSLYSFSTPFGELEGHDFQIFNGEGDEITSDDTVLVSNRQLVGTLNWIAPSSGAFFLRATHPAVGSTYTLIMSRYLDDQAGAPASFSVPDTLSGTLDFTTRLDDSDADLFRFDAIAGHTYNFVPLDDVRVELSILDDQLAAVHPPSIYQLGQPVPWTAPDTGTYYLRVMGDRHRRGREMGPYAIHVEAISGEPGDQPPLPLQPDEPAVSQFRFYGDYRDVTFQVLDHHTYRFSGTLPGHGKFEIWNSNGAPSQANTGAGGTFSMITTLSSGTYIARIRSDLPGAFQISMDPVEPSYENNIGELVNNTQPSTVDSSHKNSTGHPSAPGSADETDDDPLGDSSDDSGDDSLDDSADNEAVDYADVPVDDAGSSDLADLAIDDTTNQWLDDSSDLLDPSAGDVW